MRNVGVVWRQPMEPLMSSLLITTSVEATRYRVQIGGKWW